MDLVFEHSEVKGMALGSMISAKDPLKECLIVDKLGSSIAEGSTRKQNHERK